MAIQITCKNCFDKFSISPCRLNKAKFCSYQCYWKSLIGKQPKNMKGLIMGWGWGKGKKGIGFGKHPENINKTMGGWNKGMKLSEETKQKIRDARIKQIIPNKATSIEIKIQKILKDNKIDFTTYYPILGQPDIFIKPNIAVFCDGDYWHNRPGSQEKDMRITKELQNQGYIVIRLWEHEINNKIEDCFNKIQSHIA